VHDPHEGRDHQLRSDRRQRLRDEIQFELIPKRPALITSNRYGDAFAAAHRLSQWSTISVCESGATNASIVVEAPTNAMRIVFGGLLSATSRPRQPKLFVTNHPGGLMWRR